MTVAVGPLSEEKIAAALASGRRRAEALIAASFIEGALISLAGRWESVGVDRQAAPGVTDAALAVSSAMPRS